MVDRPKCLILTVLCPLLIFQFPRAHLFLQILTPEYLVLLRNRMIDQIVEAEVTDAFLVTNSAHLPPLVPPVLNRNRGQLFTRSISRVLIFHNGLPHSADVVDGCERTGCLRSARTLHSSEIFFNIRICLEITILRKDVLPRLRPEAHVKEGWLLALDALDVVGARHPWLALITQPIIRGIHRQFWIKLRLLSF